MAGVENFVINMNLQEFAGTAAGIQRLEEDRELQQVVGTFVRTEDAEATLGDRELLGQGGLGVVIGVGDLAVKVSTVETNINPNISEASRKAADLVSQFTYVTALGKHLQAEPDAGIRVPTQYFAFKTEAGNSLLVQQRLTGVETLHAWESARPQIGEHEERRFHSAFHERIANAVDADHPLRNGLNDLLLPKPDYIQRANIMVPTGSRNPQEDTLYVIDQPGPSRFGALAARQAKGYLRDLTTTRGRFGIGRRQGRPVIRSYAA